MTVFDKILNHGVGCFDELVEMFSEKEIDEMNCGFTREDYTIDFYFKYAVVYQFVKDWLIKNIGSDLNDRETVALFKIYCAM